MSFYRSYSLRSSSFGALVLRDTFSVNRAVKQVYGYMHPV